MAYQVLALKWRPQTFEDVVGQGHVTRTLQNAIRQERVPHAFLLTGSRGVGKTTTARILAKALICEHGPTPDPCGKCRFCTEVREGRSLDVLEIDGASNTGVDNIRELRENAGYAPSAARSKIYIIDEVHMLSTSAFNALLKTLEEPPEHVTFIFATTEVNKVPITIQSRCQRFDFRLLTREEILKQLRRIVEAEKIEISDAALAAVAAAAEGSLRDSQTLLDQVLAYSGRRVEEKDVYEALGIAEEKTVLSFLEMLLERKGAEAIRILDLLLASGCDPKSFSREVLVGLRNLAVLKSSPDLSTLVTASQGGLEALRTLAEPASLGRIHALFDIFLQAEEHIRSASFPRMLLELAVLQAVRVEEIEDLRGLVERLEALEGNYPAARTVAEGENHLPPQEVPRADGQDPSGEEAEEECPAPPAGPESRDDLFRRLVERVRKDSVVQASFLEHGKISRIQPGRLEIVFEERNGLFIDTLKETENLTLLRRAAQEVLGRKIEVRLVVEEGREGAGGKNRARESDLKKKYRREAIEHPLIQGILEVFQAQVIEVKVL